MREIVAKIMGVYLQNYPYLRCHLSTTKLGDKSKPKLGSEIVWHRFFAVLAFIRHLRSYIAVRKLLV